MLAILIKLISIGNEYFILKSIILQILKIEIMGSKEDSIGDQIPITDNSAYTIVAPTAAKNPFLLIKAINITGSMATKVSTPDNK